MDISKMLSKSSLDYQLVVARSILSFSRADAATQSQLLDSYKAIIQEFEDDKEAREYEFLNQEKDATRHGRDIDEYLDDPRHGQAAALNEGSY